MKIPFNVKKYDLVTLEVDKGIVKNCLVQAVHKGGLSIYPIQQYIEDAEHPRAVAKIFVPYDIIVAIEPEKIKLLFYTVNTRHPFLREALDYHMKNESESRQNKTNNL
jgi:hypothetical protein